jgi:iron(III) transport system substrate-binding protein
MEEERRMRTKRTPLVLVLLLALVLAACGGDDATDTTETTAGGGDETTTTVADDTCSVQELIDETEGMTGPEREAFLLERAKDEDPVSLYTELNARDTDELAGLWEDTYDLDITVYRAGSEDVRLRVLEEAAADFRGFDLIEIEALDMTILEQEGILAPASSPYRDTIIDAGVFDTFTADRVTYLVPGWNTDIVTDPPQDFRDLADPRFDGILALEDSDIYWFAALVGHFMETEGLSQDEAVQIFKDIAANGSITSGHTTTLELLIAGQYGITPNAYSHRIQEFKEEGAPLEWLPVNVPVVAEITAVAVACNPRNPASALLLEDFFLSPDYAQPFYVSVNRTPGNAALAAEAFGPGGDDIQPIRADVGAIVNDFQTWTDLWDEVVLTASV